MALVAIAFLYGMNSQILQQPVSPNYPYCSSILWAFMYSNYSDLAVKQIISTGNGGQTTIAFIRGLDQRFAYNLTLRVDYPQNLSLRGFSSVATVKSFGSHANATARLVKAISNSTPLWFVTGELKCTTMVGGAN
jgi:hypothetical protein